MSTSIIQFGGLGNQMFIYALFYAMKKKGVDVKIDASLYNFIKMHNGYEIPIIFDTNDDYVCRSGWWIKLLRLLLHYKPSCLLYSDKYVYDSHMFECKKPFINGYFQLPLYFDEYKDELLDIFSFKNISSKNIELANKMHEEESVSLHIRRGDYLNSPSVYGLCTEDYYIKAIQLIKEKVANPYFYIFSNDACWSSDFAKSLGIKFFLVSYNYGVNSYQDMYLMSQCKHNILANSTFSWWGAYLNTYENSIKIAPKIWNRTYPKEYNSLCTPKSWLRL